MHGAVNGNGREAPWLYQERFSSKRIMNHKMFQLLHQHLCENGSFIDSTYGRSRSEDLMTNAPGSRLGPSG
ncbi:hypothetical protein TNCV_5057611 [Trichonephila clavipes]|nr:hypothetical protein TNCV_5057611 [Trichonephila clavipes]